MVRSKLDIFTVLFKTNALIIETRGAANKTNVTGNDINDDNNNNDNHKCSNNNSKMPAAIKTQSRTCHTLLLGLRRAQWAIFGVELRRPKKKQEKRSYSQSQKNWLPSPEWNITRYICSLRVAPRDKTHEAANKTDSAEHDNKNST